jgi:hypothetical protein
LLTNSCDMVKHLVGKGKASMAEMITAAQPR